MHKIEYKFDIHLIEDGITIQLTGEGVSFHKTADNAVIRLRHNKLVVSLSEVMKDYMRDSPHANPR